MTVTGGDKVAAAFRRLPALVRERVEDALQQAGGQVLADMKMLTPVDTGSVRGALTMRTDEGGLAVHVGLPTRELAEDFFWFRFMDMGTKGGEVMYRRAGSAKRQTMRVPARPALHVRDRALDANRDDIERLIRQAVQRAVREMRA